MSYFKSWKGLSCTQLKTINQIDRVLFICTVLGIVIYLIVIIHDVLTRI